MSRRVFRITQEEMDRLVAASERARHAPVMLIGSVDVSRSAYDDLYGIWREIGLAHGFDGETALPAMNSSDPLDVSAEPLPGMHQR